MKNIFLITVFASITISNIQAQTWTVGVPVNRTIIDYPVDIFVTITCDTMSGQEAEFRIALPQVAGINYYVVIDNATNPTHTYELRQGVNIQIMSLGDSMQIFSTAPVDTIHLSYAGYESSVSVKFKAIGTPTIAGQSYPCGSTDDGWYNLPIGCMYPNFPDNTTYLTNCIVQSLSSIDDLPGSNNVLIFPNPAKAILNIQVANTDFSKHTKLLLINTLGQTVKQVSVERALTTVDIANLTLGIYHYQLQNDSGILKIGKIVIEE